MHAMPTSLVTFLLDRSSSMTSILDATLEGFNGYLRTLKAERDAKIDFTLLFFDAHINGLDIQKVWVAVPVAGVAELDVSTYVPRGSTPLIDAALATIRAVEASLAKRSDKPKVVICIQTDGHENCSKESWASLKALVQAKQEAGWEFNFMGAGIDAYEQAARMGVSAMSTVSYDAQDMRATSDAFMASAVNAAGFAAGRMASTAYTMQQRASAKDRFAPSGLSWAGGQATVQQPLVLAQAAAQKPAAPSRLDLSKPDASVDLDLTGN